MGEHETSSFRLTQILTEHGVFGSYLARIGKEETAECRFFGALENDVNHTLSKGSRGANDWQCCVQVIEQDLTIRGLVKGLLCCPREWFAISRFAETVIRRKENRKREREILEIRRLQSGAATKKVQM